MISMKSNYVNHKTTTDCYGFKNDDGGFKISTDFERMGDNATHSSYSSSSKDYRSLCINSIKTMGKLAMLMLQDLNTTKQEDITLIKEIIERDKDIDDLYANIVNTTYLIDNDPL